MSASAPEPGDPTIVSLRVHRIDRIVQLRGSFERDPFKTFIEELEEGEIVLESDEELTLSLPTGSRDTSRLLEHAASMDQVSEVSIRPPSLERLFIRLTGRELRE